MPDSSPDSQDRSRQRQRALSRWENEGGAGPKQQTDRVSGDVQATAFSLTDAELVQLQVRVIALENVVIALLAQAPDRQLDLVREMAAYISPRPGFTPHRLTIHAAAQMVSLVERAGQFRAMPPS